MNLTSNSSAERFGEHRSIEFVRQFLQSDALAPRIPEIEEFVGQLSGLPLLQLMPREQHRSVRVALDREFSARAIGKRDQVFAEASSLHSSRLNSGVEISLRRDFALPLVWTLSTEFVGIPSESAEAAQSWASEVREFVGLRRSRRILALLRLSRLLNASRELIDDRVEDSIQHPVLLPLLASLKGEVPDDVVNSVSLAVLTAGVELVVRSILATVWLFINHPERMVKATYTSTAINQAIAFARIIPGAERIADSDSYIDTELIRKGQKLRIDLCPGSRSVRGFPYNCNEFGRNEASLSQPPADQILPFGFGEHFCLGASWTRYIVRNAVSVLFSTYASVEIIRPIEAQPCDPLGGPTDLKVVFE
jgi:cytochrome P450